MKNQSSVLCDQSIVYPAIIQRILGDFLQAQQEYIVVGSVHFKMQGFNRSQYDGVSLTDYINIMDHLESDEYQKTWIKCVAFSVQMW